MTEDDAKTKWCPMFRRSMALSPKGSNTIINNRELDPVRRSSNCIGTECMAWRSMNPGSEDIDPAVEDAGTVISFVFVPHGYCGLAGEPE